MKLGEFTEDVCALLSLPVVIPFFAIGVIFELIVTGFMGGREFMDEWLTDRAASRS